MKSIDSFRGLQTLRMAVPDRQESVVQRIKEKVKRKAV